MAKETLDEKKTEEEEATPVKGKDEEKIEKGNGEECKEVSVKNDSQKTEETMEVDEKEEEEKVKEEEVEKEEEKEVEEEEEDSGDEGTKSAKGSGRKGSSRKPSRGSAEKKEPVTPSSDRPTRERKVVERYSAPSVARSSSAKSFSIEKGRGTQLKDIPNVAFKLSKRKADDNLQMLHVILFGKKAKPYSLKRNIGQFSGYVWVENEQEKPKAKVREKIEKCVKEKLVDFCDLLNIPIAKATVRKEEVSAKLLEFLESPHATTDILLADKEEGKKRKAIPSKNIGSGEASDTSAKRQRAPQGGEKHKRSSKAEEEDVGKVESPVSRDSHEDDADTTPKEENDDEETKSEKEEEPKKSSEKSTSKKTATESPESKSKDKSTPGKKVTPAKSSKKSPGSTSKKDVSDGGTSGSKSKGSASKKSKVEKESSKGGSTKDKVVGKKQTNKSTEKVSAKSQGKGKSGKKPKPEPTREEIHDVVVDVLKKVDFNTATLSDILRQLGAHFGLDLMHRKAEVKDIITEVINNMTDEDEEGEESEENADTGGGADKDSDGDD
ncbi:protein DEK-like isoform X3 [Hibiscus syriacus]|uniref:protein DEK-like isoform X3 n=1 Tax=Hibiscus syriacus TaxID=106335 RepID=UPI001922483C|nr:protein DEK-like isoform X3 [Hibiscus syriacus]